MSLFNKIQSPFKKSGSPLFQNFKESLETRESPYVLAINALEELESTAKTEQELINFFLEDIIFTSLYATFYEQILITIHQNPEVAPALINRYAEDAEKRENVIAAQTQAHLDYIENLGECDGCPHCENHSDVNDLITYWRDQDFEFFSGLYLGMQTIQFAMENLIYRSLLDKPELIGELELSNILNFRKDIISFVEKKIGPIEH